MQNWDAQFLHRSPLFEALRVHGAVLRADDWPDLAALQALLSARDIVSGGGRPLRIVPQGARGGAFEERYEARIYRDGELPMRARNWHDLFNLLAWLSFPRAKAALNARHYGALLEQRNTGAANRGPAQDALTLFDESGLVVASSDSGLLQQVRDFAWKRLFWAQRDDVIRSMRWLVFGHALCEKALHPYVGITGHGVLLEVGADFHEMTPARQLACIDAMLAARIADPAFLRTTRALSPVPLLGIPGWWPANSEASFYDNTAYFRPGRRAPRTVQATRGKPG